MSFACQRAPEPDLRSLERWLVHPALTAPDGRVFSWVGPARTGYPYDEATAMLARLFAWRAEAERAEALGAVLEQRLVDHSWLSKGRVGYVFDTALALPVLRDPEPTAARVAAALEAGLACEPITRPGWWSQSFGAHLIKCTPLLATTGRRRLAVQVAEHLVDRCFDGDRFRIHGHSDATYVHSHCYALEGLLGLGTHPDVIRAGADWLLRQQHDDGSLPAWVGGSEPQRRPSDIVAQAVRIWSLTEPDRYAVAIERALGHLSRMQDPTTGGLRYEPDSSDFTSWVAVFAVQAIHWASTRPAATERGWII